VKPRVERANQSGQKRGVSTSGGLGVWPKSNAPNKSLAAPSCAAGSPSCLSALGFHPGTTEACQGLQAFVESAVTGSSTSRVRLHLRNP
jgi:hypothetical protein